MKELRHLQIRREVLNKEKELINKFSKHVSTMHTVEVCSSRMPLTQMYACDVDTCRALTTVCLSSWMGRVSLLSLSCSKEWRYVHQLLYSLPSVTTFPLVQSKLSDLDSRLSVIAGEEKCLQDKLAVLQANADKLNPKNKKATTETLR